MTRIRYSILCACFFEVYMWFVPVLIMAVGVYFLVRLRAFFLFRPIRSCRVMCRAFRREEGRGFVTFSLALAGTLGVGNLSGVALGLLVGGAGSLFWMWISSIFACVLKYAEVLISKDVCISDDIGMIGVVRRFVPKGRFVSILYAFVCLLLSFSMGAILQSRAVCESAVGVVDISSPCVSLALSVLLLLVILGGIGGVERAVSVTVPIAALGYIVLSVGVLCCGYRYIPTALCEVLRGAFCARGVSGGLVGIVTSAAVRRGFACGLLSNEAGAGTSAMAHVRSRQTTASEQGMIGLCEVLCDTAICTLTALSMLVGTRGCLPSVSDTQPLTWVSDVFAFHLGAWSRVALLFCVFAFAFSTIICWYYYGRRCALYLWRGMPSSLFAALYVLCTFLGGVIASRVTVWIVDGCLGVLCILSLGALLAASDRISSVHRVQFFAPKRHAE